MKCTHQNRISAMPGYSDPLGQDQICIDCDARFRQGRGWSGGDTEREQLIDEMEFFIVWSPEGTHNPAVRHWTLEQAAREAERLAQQHVGKEFVVLRSIVARQVPPAPMRRVRYEDGPF